MKFIAEFAAFFSIFAIAFCSPLITSTPSSGADVNAGETTEAMSNSESSNPFLRHKRDVNCPIPQYLPQLVQELNTFLPNASAFIGLPQQQAIPTIPAGQPTPGVCPAATGSWWPGTTDNLKSTCPWVYRTVDLGDTFYPRYILDVDCLCASCISSNALSCTKLRTDVTVFQRGACRDGLAVMTAVKQRVTSGCFCAGAPTVKPVAPPTE